MDDPTYPSQELSSSSVASVDCATVFTPFPGLADPPEWESEVSRVQFLSASSESPVLPGCLRVVHQPYNASFMQETDSVSSVDGISEGAPLEQNVSLVSV